MVSTTEGCTDNIPIIPNQSETTKRIVQENHPVKFQKHCMSKIRLLFTG